MSPIPSEQESIYLRSLKDLKAGLAASFGVTLITEYMPGRYPRADRMTALIKQLEAEVDAELAEMPRKALAVVDGGAP
jgi:hypothetical protein